MSVDILAMPLGEFRDRAASREPTPGGGSVSAVAGALGLGLVIMALEITLARKLDDERKARINARVAEARALLARLSEQAPEDIAVFERYMAAVALPKATPEETTRRTRAMADAAAVATETPLRTARTAVEALGIARESVALVHRWVVSDVGAGAALLSGAVRAVLFNVDVNLDNIATAGARDGYRREREDLERRATALGQEIEAAVRAVLAPASS